LRNDLKDLNSSGRHVLGLSGREPNDIIVFHGHSNILGLHRNTIEVTKDKEITTRADCIIGVQASKACADLSGVLRDHIRVGGRLFFEIEVDGFSFAFSGKGHEALDLSDRRELVLRKSEYVSSRTAAIGCNAAAKDIPRPMIKTLQEPYKAGTLRILAIVE
jgi:uncharacterized protein